jgi:transcription elongation GreA/GreB family factor
MSRAFVKEQDVVPEELTERSISTSPNIVTQRGLKMIEAEIEASRRLLEKGQSEGDKPAIARAARDLRYWTQRRSSAQLFEHPARIENVGFGTRVTFMRNDHRKQVFAIVGEDESDPPNGYIAYTSPMARALIGKSEGDVVDIPGGEAEILLLEPIGAEG